MQLRHLSLTIFLVAVLVVSLGLVISGSVHPSTIPQVTQPYETPEALVESVEVQAKVVAPNPTSAPTTVQPTASEVTSPQEGPSLLKEHCAGCHMVQLLEQTRKSRAGWEKALTEMEKIGVYLNETEKTILIDYLTSLSKR